MGKMENLTPCKIETLEQIDTQFVRIDYVHEMNVCSKFGKKSVHGRLLGKGVKYNFLCDFIYLFFLSDQRREETPGRILTRNGSKDAESRKDVPFWGYKMKN